MVGSRAVIGVLVDDDHLKWDLVGALTASDLAVRTEEPSAWDGDSRADIAIVLADPSAAERCKSELLSMRPTWPAGTLSLLVVLPRDGEATAWLRAGFDDIVRWPVSREELGARLQTMIRLRSENASRWRAVFDAVDHPVFVVGPDFRIAAANRALGHLHGVAAGALVGRPCWEVLHAPGQETRPVDCPMRSNRPAGKGDAPLGDAPRLVHASFKSRRYQVSCTPVVDHAGRLLRTIHVATDITEQIRTEERLRLSETRLRTIFEGATEGIVTADGETHRLSAANPACCKMLGYAPEEIEGLSVEMIHPPESLPHVIEQFERQLRGEIACAPDLPVRRKDGSIFYADVTAFPVTIAGRDYLVGLFRDVTERRQVAEEREALEAQLRHAQKMEAVGGLAGGVAHDFNNILMAIVGNVELARSLLGSEAGGSEPLEEPLEQIAQAARRAATLTRDLLAFSRREAAEPHPVDLNEVLRSMAKMFAPVLGERVQLSLSCDVGLQPVMVDPRLIERVVVNLLVNARDAMPDGGVVRLATRNVTIDQAWVDRHGSLAPGPHVTLVVEDDGCGMDRETAERIFEPFFTTKELGRGTGLGLATVYGIIKQAGGHILVESEPGRGTTFSIYLPVVSADAEVVDPERSSGAASTGGGETILLCDDDEVVLEVAARMLREGGYRVVQAASGAEALQRVAELGLGIDLVVTDVVMPEIDGVQLAQRVAAIHPEIRFLFTSGHPADGVGRRGRPVEPFEFLAKPFTRAELMARVRELLERTAVSTGPAR